MKKTSLAIKLLALSVGLAGLSVHPSTAASINWATPTVITSDAALDAPLTLSGYTGTLVNAVTFGPSAYSVTTGLQTVNFVTGSAVVGPAPGSGNNTTAYASGPNDFYGGVESNNGVFTGDTGNADFNSVLRQHNYTGYGAGAKLEMNLSGLTIGNTYALQIFMLDDRPNNASDTYQFSDGVGGLSAVFANSANSYVLGTFVATSTTQYFAQVGGSPNLSSQFNAYTLSSEIAAVP